MLEDILSSLMTINQRLMSIILRVIRLVSSDLWFKYQHIFVPITFFNRENCFKHRWFFLRKKSCRSLSVRLKMKIFQRFIYSLVFTIHCISRNSNAYAINDEDPHTQAPFSNRQDRHLITIFNRLFYLH